MDNILDFKTFKNKRDLEQYAEKLTAIHLKLKEQHTELQDKIVHLENLLKAVPQPESPQAKLAVASVEEEILKRELHRINEASMRGPLDSDTISDLKKLVEALAIARGKMNNPEVPKKDTLKRRDPKELLRIVSDSSDEETNV